MAHHPRQLPQLLPAYLEPGVSSVHGPSAFVVGDMSTMAGQLAVTLPEMLEV